MSDVATLPECSGDRPSTKATTTSPPRSNLYLSEAGTGVIEPGSLGDGVEVGVGCCWIWATGPEDS